MDNVDKLLKSGILSLLVFECRYGGHLYAILAPNHLNQWVESEMNGCDNDWYCMSSFLENYKDKLFFANGTNLSEVLMKISTKVAAVDDQKLALNQDILEYGYSLYKTQDNWFIEEKALKFE